MTLLVFSFLAALAVSTVSTGATQLGQGALTNWKIMDACTREAQKAYPEYNVNSNAKRDAKLNQCLSTNILPPRQPLATPDPR